MAKGIEVACPHCAKRMLVSPDSFGGPVGCVECSRLFTADEATLVPEGAPPAPDEESGRYDVAGRPPPLPIAPAPVARPIPPLRPAEAAAPSPVAEPIPLLPDDAGGRSDVPMAPVPVPGPPATWRCLKCQADVTWDMTTCPFCGTTTSGEQGELVGVDRGREEWRRDRTEQSMELSNAGRIAAVCFLAYWCLNALGCVVLMTRGAVLPGLFGVVASGASAYIFWRCANGRSGFWMAFLGCVGAWCLALCLNLGLLALLQLTAGSVGPAALVFLVAIILLVVGLVLVWQPFK